jgi:hypothetical protein
MIKSEIRSLIKNSLPKFDSDAKFHNRYLDAVIEKVLSEMYWEVWSVSPLALQGYCKRYGGTTAIAVAQDLNANIYYSNYPARYIPFSDKASGVRRITTRQQGGFTFFPMDEREVELVNSGSYVNTVSDKIGYVVTPERIEYWNMSAAVVAAGVRMDIVIPFSVYADSDNVVVPEISSEAGETFVERVIKVLVALPTPDVKDDNTTEREVK